MKLLRKCSTSMTPLSKYMLKKRHLLSRLSNHGSSCNLEMLFMQFRLANCAKNNMEKCNSVDELAITRQCRRTQVPWTWINLIGLDPILQSTAWVSFIPTSHQLTAQAPAPKANTPSTCNKVSPASLPTTPDNQLSSNSLPGLLPPATAWFSSLSINTF